jgi:peptide/nickel transport system substrate-binding protein
MEKLGYGPGNRLKVKLMTRDVPSFRDPAVLLIDQLKEVYIDGDLEPVDTTNFFPRMVRRDFSVALSLNFTRTK